MQGVGHRKNKNVVANKILNVLKAAARGGGRRRRRRLLGERKKYRGTGLRNSNNNNVYPIVRRWSSLISSDHFGHNTRVEVLVLEQVTINGCWCSATGNEQRKTPESTGKNGSCRVRKKDRRARVRHNRVWQTDCLFYWLRHGRSYVHTQIGNVLMCVNEIRTDRGIARTVRVRVRWTFVTMRKHYGLWIAVHQYYKTGFAPRPRSCYR